MSKKERSIDDYSLLCLIGKGSCGRAYLVRQIATDNIYAMKVVKKKYLYREGKVQNIFTERGLMIQFNNPFIIKILYSFQNEKKVYMILQYCPGGDLMGLLELKTKFTEEQAKFYIAQVILALNYMHERDVVYRDLKPENILVDKFGYIKLTDFGLSKKVKKNEPSKFSISGIPQYSAPQILLQQNCSKAVDYWCLGEMLYEMLTGIVPFYSENLNQMYQNIKNKPFVPDESFKLSSQCVSFLQGLFVKDPLKRLGSKGFEQIQNHQWFKGINWKALEGKKYKAPFIPVLASESDTSYFCSQITKQSLNSYDQSYSQSSFKDSNLYDNFQYSAEEKQK